MENQRNLLKELVDTLERINETNEQITGIVNNFSAYYEDLSQFLNIVKNANTLSLKLHAALQAVKEEGSLEDNEEIALQVEDILRTQAWVQKNAELADEALKKLSDLEDVTLQFYDNPHPDVVFD
jgi:hypothetical protein